MSVIALILATLLVIAMLVMVFYVGKARMYKGMYEDRKDRQSQLWQTILNNNERIVELKAEKKDDLEAYNTTIKKQGAWFHKKDAEIATLKAALKNEKEELEERVEEQLTTISGMDDQVRELKQIIDGLEKLIEIKDDEINELERSCQSPLRDQVSMLREEVIQKCNLNEALRGEVANAKELLRLAEEANIGHVKQIHQLQADKAKVLAEYAGYRDELWDFDQAVAVEIDLIVMRDRVHNDYLCKMIEKEELADGQIVEEEPTASPEPCTEMGTKPADKSA